MKGATAQMRDIYGPGLASHLEATARNEGPANLAAFGDDDMTNAPGGDPTTQMTLRLRHKRRAALLKQILKSGGYGELARVASFHNGG